MKKLFIILLLLLTLFPTVKIEYSNALSNSYFASCTNIGDHNNVNGNENISEIKLATWNIRILSNGSRDDTELAEIADILKRYDLIAIQEARDTIVLDRLKTILPEYNYIASSPVGRTVKEIYAYFYKPSVISTIGTAYTFPDPNDLFIREPYIACFRAGNFDFTLITIHVLYGDSETERREEIKLLDDVLLNVDQNNDDEEDIILLGDFNFNSTDSGWQITTHDPVGLADHHTRPCSPPVDKDNNIRFQQLRQYLDQSDLYTRVPGVPRGL